MFTHPATDPVRLGLTWNSVVKGNALTAYVTRAVTYTWGLRNLRQHRHKYSIRVCFIYDLQIPDENFGSYEQCNLEADPD